MGLNLSWLAVTFVLGNRTSCNVYSEVSSYIDI